MAPRSIVNVHQRRFAAPVEAVGLLVDQLGGPNDRLWPKNRWPAMRVPRPITLGDKAGHADVKYTVDEYEPGRILWFRFDPSCGLDGRHGVIVEPMPDGTVSLSHRIEAKAVGSGRIMWPLVVRWMHNQIVEEMLDNAEAELPGAARPIPVAVQATLEGRSRWALVLRSGFLSAAKVKSIPHHLALGTSVVGLLGAAIIHGLWATGTNWPGTNRVELARKVVGTDDFPTNRDTWIVVGLLTVATGLVVAASEMRSPTPAIRPGRQSRVRQVVRFGAGSVSVVLGIRALGGFLVSGTRFLTGSSAPFVPRDLLIYSPLCAVLAAMTIATTAANDDGG